ncbi:MULTISPECIES: P-loop NTPase fold protein [unclassified Endozoicomonas]|uniref:P-loop NTPase fold protein n=1 Tax=unclassified Endozoicomonas TaxID=2644528 RepID=UPI00214849E6|nr:MULTISPECIES: P-loop NTPase fold protein [unclassified Endozoicomonas]
MLIKKIKNFLRTGRRSLFIVFIVSIPWAAAEGSNSLVIQALAINAYLDYLYNLGQGNLEGESTSSRPFTIGLDGPSGAGKSTFLDEFTQELRAAAANYHQLQPDLAGRACNLETLGIDTFLHSRADRREMFSHLGDGASGNNDGKEYRADLRDRCLAAIARGDSFRYTPYCRHLEGRLGPEETRKITCDILIIEGTHVNDPGARASIDHALFLNSDDNLISWNMWKRNYLLGNRTQQELFAILQVLFEQFKTWRERNADLSDVHFYWHAINEVPELTEETVDSVLPELVRQLQLHHFNSGFALARLFQQNPLSSEVFSARMRHHFQPLMSGRSLVAMEHERFLSNIKTLLEPLGLTLYQVEHGNECLFVSLESVLRPYYLNRDRVIALLRQLWNAWKNNRLTDAQRRLLGWVAGDIEAEADFLSQGNLGGLPTILMTWAALMGSSHPPDKPLYLMIRLGSVIKLWSINLDGSISELAALPEGEPVLIYDGVNRWMFATPGQGVPGDMAGVVPVVHPNAGVHNGGGSDDDSGFYSSSSSSSSSSLSSLLSSAVGPVRQVDDMVIGGNLTEPLETDSNEVIFPGLIMHSQ